MWTQHTFLWLRGSALTTWLSPLWRTSIDFQCPSKFSLLWSAFGSHSALGVCTMTFSQYKNSVLKLCWRGVGTSCGGDSDWLWKHGFSTLHYLIVCSVLRKMKHFLFNWHIRNYMSGKLLNSSVQCLFS